MFDATLRVIAQDQESHSTPDAHVSRFPPQRTYVAHSSNVVPIFSAKQRAQNVSANMRGKATEEIDSKFKYPMLECK